MRKFHESRFTMKAIVPVATILGILAPFAAQAAAKGEAEIARITESGRVMRAALYGHSGIPLDILNKAECVIVLPSVKKAAFIVGASYGRGVMTCRSGAMMNGRWSSPTMMQSAGGSFGFQAGGQATDYVLLVMNDKGARSMLNGKVKLGGDASIAAGPIGRTAEAATNASMTAQILSYSRAQGIFAGLSLSGSTLGPDDEANANIYGKKVTATDIIEKGEVKTPPSAQELIKVLAAKSPRNTSKK